MASPSGPPGDVGQVKVVKDMPRMEEALTLLKKLHSLCKPIQKKYGWYLPTLTEFFPSNPNLLGMNRNHGETIFIRLRPADDKSSFLPLEESLVGTLLHEFTHNVHGPHHKEFYEFLDKLQDEYDVLRTGGYSGEGFFSEGKRAGSTPNLPPHLARAKALQGAQHRQQIYSIMGPAGGNRLGAGRSTLGKTPRQMAAESAERRALDDKACGHGEAVSGISVEQEMDKATQQSTTMSDTKNASTSVGTSDKSTPTSHTEVSQDDSDDSDIEVVYPVEAVVRKLPGTAEMTRKPPIISKTSESRKRPPAQALAQAHKTSKKNAQSWICQSCTYDNEKPMALCCEICGTQRPEDKPRSGANVRNSNLTIAGSDMYPSQKASGKFDSATWVCHLCGAETEHQWWTCRLCGHMKLSSSNG